MNIQLPPGFKGTKTDWIFVLIPLFLTVAFIAFCISLV